MTSRNGCRVLAFGLPAGSVDVGGKNPECMLRRHENTHCVALARALQREIDRAFLDILSNKGPGTRAAVALLLEIKQATMRRGMMASRHAFSGWFRASSRAGEAPWVRIVDWKRGGPTARKR